MIVKPLPFEIMSNEIKRLRKQAPLIHCLTNEVVQNFTANCLLALDCIPAMIVAKQEVASFTQLANNVLINVGTLYDDRLMSMQLAAKTADENNKNWVLDPVAIGALAYRTEFVHQLLTYRPKVIRANASEILALAGCRSLSKGPDSSESSDNALPIAQEIALKYQTIVALTGETDYITDGIRVWSVPWGSPIMTKVTGCGCALSAVVAAFVAEADDILTAAASACAVVAMAGQYAANKSAGPGSFVPLFIDTLYQSPSALVME